VEVGRRGKYLILSLEGDRHLVMHLRMTGNLLLVPADHASDEAPPRFGAPRLYESAPDARFLRAAFELDDGSELWFTDARRFGHGVVLDGVDKDAYLAARLGIEPLSGDLTPERLASIAAGRTAPLKSFLLDQAGIAGIGNIYADEALHRASLHPLSPAGSMRAEHCQALVEGIIDALEAGLAHGGSSIDDYRDARGQECPRCGEAIRRIVVGGRSTYFCPACQTRLRRRRKGGRKR
jgi:formamidopyrimidine-DNA glycosylase